MQYIDPSLEKLYLYGKLLLTQLPAGDSDPMPQISKQVQLTHLRMAATEQTAIELETGEDTPGTALPGGVLGKQTEPTMDRLSALIAVMNEKFGAELSDADKLTFEQTRMDLMHHDDMRIVAENNDRAQYRIVLEDKADDIILDRGNRNRQLFDLYRLPREHLRRLPDRKPLGLMPSAGGSRTSCALISGSRSAGYLQSRGSRRPGRRSLALTERGR